jgi:hypothetical protein
MHFPARTGSPHSHGAGLLSVACAHWAEGAIDGFEGFPRLFSPAQMGLFQLHIGIIRRMGIVQFMLFATYAQWTIS